MAITWSAVSTNRAKGEAIEYAKILDAVTTAADGEWFASGDLEAFILDVQGIAGGAVVSITGSNEPTVPANTDHERLIGTTITADGIRSLEKKEIPRWMKVRKSTTGTGAVDAYAKRVRNLQI